MSKWISIIVVLVIAIAGASYLGLFGGGMSAEDINARLKARQAANVAALGTKLTDDLKVSTINVKDTTARHVLFVDANTDMAAAQSTITKVTCEDADAAELLAGGATMRFEVENRDDADDKHTFELTSCPG